MKAIHTTLAAALLAASGFASAAPAFEGGEASQGLTFEPAVTVTQAAGAQVERAQGAATTAAAFEGGQASAGLTFEPRAVAGQRTRADVRAEGAVAVRGTQQVFEGGQAS